MRQIGSLVAAGLVTVLIVGGCGVDTEPEKFASPDFSRPTPLVLRSEAVMASKAFSDQATVEATEIRVPRTPGTEQTLAKLVAGTVLAGDRGAGQNPLGFLRRVKSVRDDGQVVVIATEQAYLDDLISQGDLVWGEGGGESLFGTGSGGQVGTLAPMPSGVGSGETDLKVDMEAPPDPKVKYKPVISVSNGKMSLATKFTGAIQFRRVLGVPVAATRASARVDFDPMVAADIRYGVKVQSVAGALGGSFNQTWEGQSVVIPIAGPIPMTIRLRPELSCALSASGEVSASTRLELRGHAAAGFTYAGGLDIETLNETPSLSASHQFLGITGKAGLTGECKAQAVVSLLAFDALGFELKAGPYASVTATACATFGDGNVGGGLTLHEQHGLRVDGVGRLQVPGLARPSLTKSLLSFSPIKSSPRYLVGSAATCTPHIKDSCVGKVDGLYCSELADFGAYQCKNGAISGGQQCPSPTTCVGPNGPGSTIQCR